MNVSRTAFRIHRVLSYVVFAQVLAWILGGVVFALLPFDDLVKGGVLVEKPSPRIAGDWRRALAADSSHVGEITRLETFASPAGPAFRVRGEAGQAIVLADGSAWRAPDSAAVAQWARSLYRAEGRLVNVARQDRDVARAGIVRETGDRRDLWRATFDDRLHTRLYFDGPSGEFVMVRNDAWVLYDFFFRLHVMDYAGGENFNNLPLRFFAVTALAFASSGLVLTFLAARRALGALRRERYVGEPPVR